MLGLADAILLDNRVDLYVASVSKSVSRLTVLHGTTITYFVIPLGRGNEKFNKEYDKYWISIENTVRPDIVHIHGTEYTHGLSYINACGATKVVVSIQGLTSACSYYYYYGLSISDIIKSTTIRSFLRGGVLKEYRSFRRRGQFEVDLLRKVNNVIGRTTWDMARVWEINPNAKYYFCNEVLRSEFYDGSWDMKKCERYSIFISQAAYPIKGLHMLLSALPLVLRDYPETQVRIAGANITKKSDLLSCIKLTNYGNLIRRMIKELNLQNHVTFLGPLDATRMKAEYQRANVFICPSSIENSPNSLGEAQLLGVPCIASYVGGIPDFIPDESSGYLYRFEEVSMLAKLIEEVFKTSSEFDNSIMRERAFKRHDATLIANQMIQIYERVSSDK